jgi:hypothetical protein
VDQAHARHRLDQLLGQELGVAAVHDAADCHRAALDLDLDLGCVELGILGQNFVQFAG